MRIHMHMQFPMCMGMDTCMHISVHLDMQTWTGLL